MIRGTNHDFQIKMPYDYDDVPYITVVFWQKDNNGSEKFGPLPIKKFHDDCIVSAANNKEITVTLNPDETARFLDDRKAYMQFSATTSSGIRFGCTQREITVYPMYNDSILGDITPSSENNGLIILDGGDIE